jgi:hypothetical protein
MAVLLCATAMALVGCEDNSRLEGTYIVEGGTGERIFVFSEELLVMYQFIDTEMVEFHYTYEIESYEDGAERLILTYKGLVYGGSDPNVSTYVTGMRVNYAKNPTQTSTLEIGDGYIVVSGQKLILQ